MATITSKLIICDNNNRMRMRSRDSGKYKFNTWKTAVCRVCRGIYYTVGNHFTVLYGEYQLNIK